MQNTVSQEYIEWKKRVNVEVQRVVGMDCDDLPDYDYYSAFVSGMSVTETAQEAVSAAKGY